MAETVLVSQLGARAHYAVPRILAGSGRLAHFYTDICATQGWPRLLSAIPTGVMPNAVRRLAARVTVGIPSNSITSFPGFGIHSAVRRLCGKTRSAETANALWAGQRLSSLVVRSGFHGAAGLYAFSGEALEQLRDARSEGLVTIVEQVIAPREVVDHLIALEEERHPDWHAPEPPDPFASEYAARERAEWAEADLVICPSEFVRKHVVQNGGDAARCVVVPYGVDSRFAERRHRRVSGPLRVLTVGQVGLRKGSPYVLQAALRMTGHAVFKMAGHCSARPEALALLSRHVDVLGPIPRTEMNRIFEWADVFLLPTLCEGSAISVYEALSAGLPVITTPNAGSVVRDGMDGFIVPPGNSDAIADALELLATDPDRLAEMAENARRRAAEFTIERYGQRLLAAIDQAFRRKRCGSVARSSCIASVELDGTELPR